MRKNKLLLLLALLMTAATGAMAQSGTPSVKKLTVPDTWTGDMTTFSAADLPSDFAAVGDDVVTTIPAPTATGNVVLIYGFSGGETKYVEYANGVQSATDSRDFPRDQIYGYVNMMGYEGVYYTAAAGTSATYSVKMKDGVKDADKWTISPNPAPEGSPVTIQYNGRLKVKGVTATSEATPAAPTGKTVDLSTLTADYVAQNGDVLTGETSSYEVTIAAGATVTLDGVTINGSSYCIKCAGDATIILKDGSTNTLTNTGGDYPALSIGDANTTLTIQGSTGVLNVSSGMYCAGIGGGYSNTNSTCGNIRIEGGVINAKGGDAGAGIGTDAGDATCGDIIITGGTITAKGGDNAAGIGSGACDIASLAVCGDITIANTVTKVTATAGENASHSIGKGSGNGSTCGTVTIGGTKYWENNAAVNGGDTYLATSPLIYDPTAPAAPAGNPAPTTASIEDYTAGTFGWDGDGSAATGLPTINTFAANDKISILSAKNTNTQFTTSAGGASATFSGTATDDSKFYAVYPYTPGLTLSGDVISGIVIPTSQWNSGWNSDSDFSGWDPKAPIAYATTTGSSLTFHNACAILKVTFPEAVTYGRFTISANEPLAGTFSLDTSTGTLTPTSGSTTVTVGNPSDIYSGICTDCNGKTVYVAIAPGTYTGFNLHIYNEDDDEKTKTKSTSVTFEAGKIYDLGSYNLHNL